MIKVILVALMVVSCGAEPYNKLKENASHLESGLNDLGHEVSNSGRRFNQERLTDLKNIKAKLKAGQRNAVDYYNEKKVGFQEKIVAARTKASENGKATQEKFHHVKDELTNKLVGERADGEDGASGSNGSDGVNGASGSIGETGGQGAQGVTGETGETGSQGSQGNRGRKGATGDDGVDGQGCSIRNIDLGQYHYGHYHVRVEIVCGSDVFVLDDDKKINY